MSSLPRLLLDKDGVIHAIMAPSNAELSYQWRYATECSRFLNAVEYLTHDKAVTCLACLALKTPKETIDVA